MSEEELNEKYIKDNIQGICQDCMWLDKIVPIIRKMLSEQYINGLEQSTFDKRMLEQENQKLTHIIEELEKYLEENKYFYSGLQNEDREEDTSIIGVLDKLKQLKEEVK